jgi:Ca-activated chloride channel family protein
MVAETEVSLDAPDSVDMGRSFDVTWVGPGAARDSVEIFDPAAKNGEGNVVVTKRVRQADFENRSVTLVAPSKPGAYVLRYYNGDSRTVLAERPLTVAETEVSITGPESVDMGRSFEVTWVGPGGVRDSADVFDPDGGNGKGKVMHTRRVAQEDIDNRTARLIAPVTPGDYLIRYVDGPTGKALASSPLTVVATEVTIEAPDRVAAEEMFEVGWAGPGAVRDSIDIMAGDRRVGGSRLHNGDLDARTVKVKAPREPGTYTLRYFNGDFSAELASRPIVVE